MSGLRNSRFYNPLNNNKKSEQIVKVKVPKSKVLPAYHDVLTDLSSEVIVCWGGAGSGKSYMLALKVLLTLLAPSRKPRRAMVCRKFGSTIMNSVWKDIEHQLEMLGILKYTKINRTARTMVLPNGAEILFLPLDDEAKIKSINQISLIWVEEASDISKDIYDQLLNRRRAPDHLLPGQSQQILLSFNPVSKANFVYKEFFDPLGNGKEFQADPRNRIVHTNYLDNPFLPESFTKVLEDYKKRNPKKYDIYALGKFASLGKLVIEEFEVSPIDLWELERNDKLLDKNGCDWGWNDPTAFVFTKCDIERRIIYIYKEIYERELKVSDMPELLRREGVFRKKILADSAQPGTIRELYDQGLDIQAAKKGHGSIMDGIAYLNDFKIIVDPSCIHTIEEFENYSYKQDKNTGEYTDEPLDNGFCHIVDALRYAYSTRDFSVKPVHRPHANLEER